MDDTNNTRPPRRPCLELAAPYSLHRIPLAQRNLVEETLRTGLEKMMGDVELLNALMTFQEAMEPAPGYDRVRITLDANHDVFVGIHYPAVPPGTQGHDPEADPSGLWLEASAGTMLDDLVEQASYEQDDPNKRDLGIFADAAEGLCLMSAHARKNLPNHPRLSNPGLTPDQLARPATIIFSDDAVKIERFEQALDAYCQAKEMRASTNPAQDKPTRIPRV